MKRRLAALTLCGALCAGCLPPALAAEVPLAGPVYDISWESLEERVRAGSPSAQMMSENIAGVEALDYDALQDRLKKQISSLADAQWMSSMKSLTVGGASVDNPYYNSYTAGTLQEVSTSLRATLDDLDDGEFQKDNAAVVRQLENGLDQLVSGGQTLYLTTLDLEQTLSDGQRGLAALDRSLTELRLRQRLGQVSQQQVAALEQTRASTVSQLTTLENGIRGCKLQLQNLLGEPPTGQLTLAPLPQADEADWAHLDYDADLAAAKEASWTLYNAQLTLDDAKDQWREDRKTGWKYAQEMADHTYAAAQASYTAAVQSFETSFRSLYDALADQEQALAAKQAESAYQAQLLATAQAQYDRGMISRNALLSAQDDLAAAQSAEETARRALFTARNQYRNAVERGLL